jgi:hypothetical protein
MERNQMWGIIRVILGTLQVAAAGTAAILLVRSGTNGLSLGVAAVAGVLMLGSRLLFPDRRTKR